MKNKGRRHKSGHGPYADGNCKGALCGITRDIRSMASPSNKPFKHGFIILDPKKFRSKNDSSKWVKKKWTKRVRGYFKSQTKDLLNQNEI